MYVSSSQNLELGIVPTLHIHGKVAGAWVGVGVGWLVGYI